MSKLMYNIVPHLSSYKIYHPIVEVFGFIQKYIVVDGER